MLGVGLRLLSKGWLWLQCGVHHTGCTVAQASWLLPKSQEEQCNKNKSKVEPVALRCCKQKSALCCSPCITCGTRSCRALFTLGLSDGTNHGLDDELGEALRDTSLEELWGPVTADIPLLLEQEEIGMTHAWTHQKDTSSEPVWRYLRQCSSIHQEMGRVQPKKMCSFQADLAMPPRLSLHPRWYPIELFIPDIKL